jgi:hypothetical protein
MIFDEISTCPNGLTLALPSHSSQLARHQEVEPNIEDLHRRGGQDPIGVMSLSWISGKRRESLTVAQYCRC